MKSLKMHVLETLEDDECCTIDSLCEQVLSEFLSNLNDLSESDDAIEIDDDKRSELLDSMKSFALENIDEDVHSNHSSSRKQKLKAAAHKYGHKAKHAIGSFLSSMWHDPHVSR